MIRLKIDPEDIKLEGYLDLCIVCLNLLDYMNDQKLNGEVCPEEMFKKIIKAESELCNLSLLDKQQILKDNDKLILWSKT
jgi:hypothetical protein